MNVSKTGSVHHNIVNNNKMTNSLVGIEIRVGKDNTIGQNSFGMAKNGSSSGNYAINNDFIGNASCDALY